tara:strand:+ start:105 stop:326 length:222 start_codon:yes stop_codon:yes gene_type:complete
MAKSNKLNPLTLIEEDQRIVYRAARRGRNGGSFTAESLAKLAVLLDKAQWNGKIRVTREFVTVKAEAGNNTEC